ncbi:MAG: ubiquinone/menaquinone biosynthesis C-methylase UbiE [Halieaceae bacterium]|jgi:ubiquinone/menaquinone biosynthesis C-methylase UbiE/DNA-binding transcriptional ArsR family regulator
MLTAQTQKSSNGAPEIRPDTDLGELSNFCKASADRLRLLILRALRQDSMAVAELCSLFDTGQSGMSHHLKILAGAGLVAKRREGNTIFYRRTSQLASPVLADVHAQLLLVVDGLLLCPEQSGRLDAIHAARSELSRQFFSDNSHKFRAQQDLIASYEQYADTVAQTLASCQTGTGIAVEIGPGDGRFLATLAPRFEQVIAVDNSLAMLEKARETAREDDLGNIEFVHGDTQNNAIAGIDADCVIANMVLHHTPSPADVIQDIARCLGPGGIFVLTDLCPHDQDWARETCGDLWLGLEPDFLTNWAASAQMTELSGTYLTQRNGFRVQVKVFKKSDQPNNQ